MSKNSETNARSTLDVLTGMEVDVHAASELAAALDVMVDTIRDERQPSFKRVACSPAMQRKPCGSLGARLWRQP